MTTVTELAIDAELAPLEEIAAAHGWFFKRLGPDAFLIGLSARDHSWFYVHAQCDRYPAMPPAWRWTDEGGTRFDVAAHAPRGGAFFHANGPSAGIICAPWNRLAYKTVDSRGPHADWDIGDWRQNPYTKACKTLADMALRIFVELTSANFAGRLGSGQ